MQRLASCRPPAPFSTSFLIRWSTLLSYLQATPLPPTLAGTLAERHGKGTGEMKTCYDLLTADPVVWKDVTDRVKRVEDFENSYTTIVKALESEMRPAERMTLMKEAVTMIAAGERLREGAEWFIDFYVTRGEKIGETLRKVEIEVEMQEQYGLRVRDKVETLKRELEVMRTEEITRREAVGVVESENGRAVYHPDWHRGLNKAMRPSKEWEVGWEAGKKGRADRVVGGDQMKEVKEEEEAKEHEHEDIMNVSSDDATDNVRMSLAMENFREGDSVLFMPARAPKGGKIWVAFTKGLHEGAGMPVPYYLKTEGTERGGGGKGGYKMGRVSSVEERTEGGSDFGIKEGRKYGLITCELI